MDYSKISIVTPSFNQGKFLEQTILSVINQKYPNLEYIIIDGGSTDNSVDIIKKYENHLTYWVSEKDNGQSDAINKGIKKCTGEIFNWLNSDDYYADGVFQEVAQSFSGGVDVVCGKHNFLYPDGSNAYSTKFPHSADICEVISSTKYLQASTFYRLDFMRKINGVNPMLHHSMDFEMWVKYLFMYGLSKIKINNNFTVNYRIHNSSKTFLSPESFESDQLKIFISIVSKFNSNVIDKYKSLLNGYKFDIATGFLDENISKRSCALFFYDRLVSFYGKRDFSSFDFFLELIDLNFLDKRRAEEVRKIKRRRLTPKWIYRLIGK